MAKNIFPPVVSVGFLDRLAELIRATPPREENGDLYFDSSQIDIAPKLFCISQSTLPSGSEENMTQKLILKMTDGTTPPQYTIQAVCKKLEDDLIGRIIQCDSFQIHKSKFRLFFVIYNYSICPGDYQTLSSYLMQCPLDTHPGFILSNPSIPSENGAQPIKLKDSSGRDNFSSNVAKKQELDYRTPATPSSMPMASSYQGEGPSNNNLYPKPHCYNYNADMPMITSQHTKNTANPYIPYPVEPPCRSENSMEGQRDGFRDKFGISAYDKPSAPQSQYGPSRGNHPSTVRGGPYALQSQLPRDSEVVSISKLALYMPKWQIQGRVTNKTDLKTFRNEQSEGQVFSIDIKDRDGEIRGTFFHKVAEKWYTVLTLNRVYAFANGQIKPKKMPFNTLNHPYEIVFDENSTISLIADELGIPKMTYDFVRIRDLTEKEVNSRVDIAAIVMKYKEIEQITRKDGQKTQKREVSLLDDSHASIALTIWGNKVTLLPEEILNAQPVVCFKGVKLGDWRGRKLDTQSSTLIECAPTDSYSIKLKEWFNRTGNNIVVENVGNKGDSMSNCKSIEEITKETANTDSSILSEKGVYFTCRAAVERVNEEKFSYPACPECRRKLVEDTNVAESIWSCGRCLRDFTEPMYTYNLVLNLVDPSGSLKCSCWNECAEILMGGIKSGNLLNLQNGGLDVEGKSFNDVISEAYFQEWIFTIRAKSETYMDETRMKYMIYRAIPVTSRISEDCCEYTRLLKMGAV